MSTAPSMSLRVALAAAALTALLPCSRLSGQTQPTDSTASASTPPAGAKESPVTLDPFEVQTTKDTSYGALNSTSITRFNMELDKAPVVADIMTSQFIEDTGVTTLADLFNGYAAGAGAVLATPSSDSTASQPGDRFSSGALGVRGLSAGNPRRDGFQVGSTQTSNTSLFDIDRVEVIHGSQGLLYGAGGAGGVVNVISKPANFNMTNGNTSVQIDQYGSKIGNLDVNEGWNWGAVRFDVLQQNQQFKELYTGYVTEGYYGAMAFKLPMNTIFRIDDEETHNNSIQTNNITVNFGGTTVDPRSGDNLQYLLKTNQLGAINPATGLPFPGGAVDNGAINAWNAKAFAGWADEEDVDNDIARATLDTRWTSWLSTSFGALWNKSEELRATNVGNLFAPLKSTNPLNDWAISTNFANSTSADRKKEYRAAVLATNDLFDGSVHMQSSLGFDRLYDDSTGGLSNLYYLANPDGSVTLNPALTNLGRTQIPTTYWAVPNGPIEYPFPKVGSRTMSVASAGGVGPSLLYTDMPADPRGTQWITANNPLGQAAIYPGITGVSTGGNSGGFAQQSKNQGFYAANFTSFWHDRLNVLLGLRESNAFTRSPNTTASIQQAYIESRSPNFPSYNAGLDFRILSWLRGYASYSRTYNVTNGSSDAYGNLPLNPTGYTYEGGFKYTSPNDAVSGSVSAYSGYQEHLNYNAGTTYENIVNPTGLNGAFVGPQGSKNQWAEYNATSKGIEAILTAQPLANWSVRLAVNAQNGTVQSDSKYPLLYNDQFYTDSKGNVTYSNGLPFLVPTDATTVAKVAKQTTPVDPTTYGVPLTQLTVAMINDPTNPYYAYGQGTSVQNEPLNGSIGNPIGGSSNTAVIKDALAQFRNGNATALTGVTGLPISAIQYNFADPAGYVNGGGYVVQKKGDRVVGAPAIRFNFTNTYDFPSGFLKGVRIGGSMALAWYNSSYYFTTPDNARHLFSAPLNNPQFNGWIGYKRKVGRLMWSTTLNVNNVFNRYQLIINPNNGTGYNTPANLTATYYGVPRLFSWTNRIAF